jgi:hypothetical protein
MNISFLILLVFIIIGIFFFQNSLYNLSRISSESLSMTYIIVFNGHNLFNELDSMSLEVVVDISYHSNHLSFSIKSYSAENLPSIAHVTGLRDFLNALVRRWLSTISLYNNVTGEAGNERIYVSVNGKIVEAYIVNDKYGESYIDPSTGLYLGGRHEFLVVFNITTYVFYPPRGYQYMVSTESYMISINPRSIADQLNVVEINYQLITITTLTLAVITIYYALKAIVRHSEYEII